ncbi:hypothetical protein C8J56DRAFT_1104396 [Mycena floridula]|nr:hypothetical protein C8J56DRAFT_1104396 [Mycena floridula]
MATFGSQMHNTVENSSFGSIGGNVLSNNTIINNYPAAKGPTRHARGYMPPANERLFGRDQEIEDIVQILTGKASSSQSKPAWLSRVFPKKPVSSHKTHHLALLGAGGQGKTATALKVMAHPAMKQFYSRKNSLWVPCDEATSPEMFLHILYNSLAITVDTHNALEDILNELQKTSKPIILLLDNFETPWNAPEARGTMARILQDIAQFPHVALFVTMRATVAPCEEIEWEEMRIQTLDPAASHQLFISIHPESHEDSKLPVLLEMLGHMALAVKLMARYGKNTGQKAAQLISGYQTTGTSMLGSIQGSDRQNSVSVSICMSLESSLVKNELNAALLLQIIAMLPSGTSPETLQQWWAENLENLNGALRVLLEALRLTDPNQLVGHVYHCYASILYTLDQYQESLKQRNLARDAYLAASKPTLAAKALIDIAVVSALIDSSFNEIPPLEQAQQELESIDEDGQQYREAMAHCLIFLGQAHSRRSNHSEALEHLTRARDFSSDLPFERAHCAHHLANAHHRLQQLDEAEKWAMLAVSEWKQIGGYFGRSLWALGKIYISKAEYDKAIRSLEEGFQCAKTYGNSLDTANILLELGRAHMKKDKSNDAKKLLMEVLMSYGNLEGVGRKKIACQYYLDKLDDPSRVPIPEEEDALAGTDHEEDIPGHSTVISSAV